MGVFSRFTDIVNANINAALDKAEDPEKIVRLIIGEMEETLVEIRANAAGYLADKKNLERKCKALTRQSAEWQSKAEMALSKGREDLARAALVEQQGYDEDATQLQSDIAKLDEILATLQEDAARLQQKLNDAKARQAAMNTRQAAAVTRLKVVQKTHSDDIDKAIAKFDSYERKIDDLEAQIEAYDMTGSNLVTAEFRKMEADEKVENALASLKASMTKKVANG